MSRGILYSLLRRRCNEFLDLIRFGHGDFMADKLAGDTSRGQEAAGALKNWLMVALTLVFVLLYGAALVGWLKPLSDEKARTRFEPIIFVIIGYYFGRMPAK